MSAFAPGDLVQLAAPTLGDPLTDAVGVVRGVRLDGTVVVVFSSGFGDQELHGTDPDFAPVATDSGDTAS